MNYTATFYLLSNPGLAVEVELDWVDDEEDLRRLLANAGLLKDRFDESEVRIDECYDLVEHFVDQDGRFELEFFVLARDHDLGDEVVLAWLDNGMPFDADEITECYVGEFLNESRFGEHIADSLGIFENCNDTVEQYFDFEAFAQDLLRDGYFEMNNNYFVSR